MCSVEFFQHDLTGRMHGDLDKWNLAHGWISASPAEQHRFSILDSTRMPNHGK
jgi:hypothetical protein